MTPIVLELKFNYAGNENAYYPVVLQNGNELLLVDCGNPGFMPLIEGAMQQQAGLSLEQLTGIIITHCDVDHLGALFEIKQQYPDIKVYSSAGQKDYIEGKEKSPRLIQAEAMQDTLPEERKEWALQFIAMLKAIKPVPVDAVFEDNETPAFLPGVQIIYTPGHMPAHISLYIKEIKTLIAADALVVENGHLEIANPQFTINIQEAVASVKKIAQLEVERIICYHGGVVNKYIKSQLYNLLTKYEKSKIFQ
jgi:glyoxylase-like metal-dependent hydrolase (beta-lactamase superfamily II)